LAVAFRVHTRGTGADAFVDPYMGDCMERPINLTPQRGPSVWPRITSDPVTYHWPLTLAVSAVAALLGLRAPRAKRWMVIGWIAGAWGMALLASRTTLFRLPKKIRPERDLVDEATEESFPASDPPSSMRVG
jgi:hypothetical protein